MRSTNWNKTVGILVMTGALLVGACASKEDVQRAQSTADQALAAAQQSAQVAQAATQKADEANAAAAAANSRADRMYQQNLKK